MGFIISIFHFIVFQTTLIFVFFYLRKKKKQKTKRLFCDQSSVLFLHLADYSIIYPVNHIINYTVVS